MKVDAELHAIVPPLRTEEREALRADIEKRGVLVPIEVDDTGYILDGHNRLEIAEALGKPYKTIIRHFADKKERVEHIIKLNLCRRQLDPMRWGQLFRKLLKVRGVERKPGPKDADTVSAIAKQVGVDPRTARRRVASADKYDKLPDNQKKAVDEGGTSTEKAYKKMKVKEREAAKRAQVINLPNRPTIYEADAFEWMREQPPCDLLLTDPPYSTEIDNIAAFAPRVIGLLKHVKPTGRAYICIGAYPTEVIAYLNASVPAPMTLSQILVWTYRNTIGPSPKMTYALNWQAILYYVGREAQPLDCPALIEHQAVQDIAAPQGGNTERLHVWQKPDELAERFIRHATKAGDTILDPFAGTGTFLLAAARLGRKAAGCDSDPGMVQIAQKRGCHAE